MGFLFLILYPGFFPTSPPPPPASVTLSTNTHHLSHTTLSHIISHIFFQPHNFVTHHLSHTTLSYTTLSPLSHIICHKSSHTSSFTHNFVTHHLSHTTLSYTTLSPLSHIICHTSFHTSSFTHNFVTHHLSHTTLSHIIFHTQLVTHHLTHHLSHNFVTHPLSHTTLSHIISNIFFHTQLCHTSSPTSSFTRSFVTHHLPAFSGTLRGRRGTWRHPPSFCGAGVPLTALGRLWWRAWIGLVAGDAAALCVAGVALGDIYFCLVWQAWHLETSTLVLRGRRGTW